MRENEVDDTLIRAAVAFTRQYGYSEVPTFDKWIGNFRGLRG
jgi:hypothetical protein